MVFMLPLWSVKKSEKRSLRTRARFEHRLFFSILAAGFPGVVLGFLLLWTNQYSLDHKIEGTIAVLLFWIGWSISARDGVVYSIRSLSNVVASVKAEDFSFRAVQATTGDAFGELSLEINSLAQMIEAERLSAMEAGNLLRKVTSEVQAVILAFGPETKVRLLNKAALSFLGKRQEEILGHTAMELDIDHLLDGPPSEIISHFSEGLEKRWILRRTSFREKGVPHRLIMISEGSDVLRAEERLAWQRLVRVLSHEINNSLAPVKSIVHTLSRIADSKLSEDIRQNFKHGLDVIGSRTEALNRFLQGYARLMKLPPPSRRPISIQQLVDRVAGLEARLQLEIHSGPDVTVNVDPDQLEQALINLVRNAVDAVLALPQGEIPSVPVTISWFVNEDQLDLRIRDRGIGLLDTSNLFVPFYTTKQSGTGIGLVLSRQIVEAHRGELTIYSHDNPPGCEVEVKIPSCIVNTVLAQKVKN